MVHEENKKKNVLSWLMWNIKGECNMKEMLLCSSESLAVSLQLSAQKIGRSHTEWSMPSADLLFVPFQLPKTVRTNTTAVIMELTNFMRDILPEDSSHSACHEIPYLLQNMKVHYCVHNPPPLTPVISHMNLVHIFL